MNANDMDPTPAASPESLTRPSRLPLIAISVLIVLAIGAAVALGLGGVDTFDEGTAEAAVQDYLNAALAGDTELVLASLVPAVRDGCEEEIGDRRFSSSGTGFTLESAAIDGDSATVTVNRRTSSNDAFGSTSDRGEQTIELRRDATGTWLISEASWPFDIDRCTGAN